MKKTEDIFFRTISILLTKNNIEDITVKKICREANQSRSVFFAYFSDKIELMNLYYAQGKLESADDMI